MPRKPKAKTVDSDSIEWWEYPDVRFPGRTVIIGRLSGNTIAASFVSGREAAVEAIRSALLCAVR
jgi:hypothetical protein